MGYSLQHVIFKFTKNQMYRFLLKQVVDALTDEGEEFTINMSHHYVDNIYGQDSREVIVLFYSDVHMGGRSFCTNPGTLVSTNNGKSYTGSVDLKIYPEKMK